MCLQRQPIEVRQKDIKPFPYHEISQLVPSSLDGHRHVLLLRFGADAETGQDLCRDLNHQQVYLKNQKPATRASLSYQTLKSLFSFLIQTRRSGRYDSTGKIRVRYYV